MGKVSPVQKVLGTLYRESMKATGHSWTRLNGVLRGAMRGLIQAGVVFQINDVAKALSTYSGDYWNSAESWYSSACGSEHADGGGNLSAAKAIEKYFGRTPFLWAERTKTAGRLCVGSQFTWEGERVTVTSFDDKAKSLTACSYTDERDTGRNDVGNIVFEMGEYRVLEARTIYTDGSLAARYSAKVPYEKKIKRRFCISNEELQTVRSGYDARRRKHEKAIKAAVTLTELDAAKEAAVAEGQNAYRHFDLEIIQAAILTRRDEILNGIPTEAERKKVIKEEENKRKEHNATVLAEWLAGADTRPYFDGIIRLRIKDNFVECSNGNKVSIDAALKTLPLVHRCRDKGWQRNGQVHDIDAFRLECIDKRGVRIGCTLISWEEVDRFTPILKKARRERKVK